MRNIFDGKKTAKLGTEKNPVTVNVQTAERSKELESMLEKAGWKYTIELDPDRPEDISSLEILLNPVQTITTEKKVGRNAPCPCESGKKYKHCCGK